MEANMEIKVETVKTVTGVTLTKEEADAIFKFIGVTSRALRVERLVENGVSHEDATKVSDMCSNLYFQYPSKDA
jgi:hypothetical protein